MACAYSPGGYKKPAAVSTHLLFHICCSRDPTGELIIVKIIITVRIIVKVTFNNAFQHMQGKSCLSRAVRGVNRPNNKQIQTETNGKTNMFTALAQYRSFGSGRCRLALVMWCA